MCYGLGSSFQITKKTMKHIKTPIQSAYPNQLPEVWLGVLTLLVLSLNEF